MLKHSPDAVVAHWCTCECFPFLVVLSCLLHNCHILALTDALTLSSSQDSCQQSRRTVHLCGRIVRQNRLRSSATDLEQIVIESKRKYVAHGSGAASQWRRTLQKSCNSLQDRLRMRTMREPGFCKTQSQLVVNVPAGSASVLVRTLGHTLYALLATLTTGRCLRLVQRVLNQIRVRSLETSGGGERTKDSRSQIRDVASCVAAGNG